MGLLQEIQAAIMDPDAKIAPILLKLRFLASRLGSAELEEWVRYESEGYPTKIEVPDYRKLNPNYVGSWAGPFGSGINNAPIPSFLIEKFAGKKWSRIDMRQSIATVDDLAGNEGEVIEISAADLILSLQGKVYPEFSCISVKGKIASTAMRDIQNVVRSRILELTIGLEKAIPGAGEVTLAKPVASEKRNAEAVTQIFNQTINGHFTAINSTGADASFVLAIAKGDSHAVIGGLIDAGVPEEDAKEFAKILENETPAGADKPFGERAAAWVKKGMGKVVDGTWKIGVGVAAKVFEEAALRYYGLK